MKEKYFGLVIRPEVNPDHEVIEILIQDLMKGNVPMRRMMFGSGYFVEEKELENIFQHKPNHPACRVIKNEIAIKRLIA